jgi:hypothetical protein
MEFELEPTSRVRYSTLEAYLARSVHEACVALAGPVLEGLELAVWETVCEPMAEEVIWA